MTAPTETIGKKEAIWLACKPKTCCYTAFVIPTGRDVWRICRALNTTPWSFLIYFKAPRPGGDSFVLDKSGQHYRIALTKKPSRRKKTPPPCIFLLRTRNGYHRCGLGDLRPQVCHSFPSKLVSDVLCMNNDAGCTCRKWALADVDIAEETALVKTHQVDFLEYGQVVAHWNDMVASASEDESFTFFDFCNFMLEAYDEIEAAATPEAVETAGVP